MKFLWYVMYSQFLWDCIHLEEMDFSIISAFKAPVNPAIGFRFKMHSKVSTHFPFLLTHVFRLINAVCFVRHLFVEYTHSKLTTTTTATTHTFSGFAVVLDCRSLIVFFSPLVVDVVPCHPAGWTMPTKGQENRITVCVDCHSLVVLFSFFCIERCALPSSTLNGAYKRRRERDCWDRKSVV